MPNIPSAAARPGQTVPPRQPVAAGNAGIFSGRLQKGTGPVTAVVTNYPRSECSGFTVGKLGSCNPQTHAPACCLRVNDGPDMHCVSVPGDASTSFAEKCDQKVFKDIGCCPIRAGVKRAMWDDAACPGKRMASPNPSLCPAQTVLACCSPAGKKQSNGMAWESGCSHFYSDTVKAAGCIPTTTTTYGCCPVASESTARPVG